MRYVTTDNIVADSVIAKAITDENNKILLNKGNKVTSRILEKLKDLDIQGIFIEDDNFNDIETEDVNLQELKNKALLLLSKQKYQECVYVAKEFVEFFLNTKIEEINILDIKNNQNYTYKHSIMCCIYSLIIGIELGLEETQLEHLAVAALLHDIGKFDIPKEILYKQEKLTSLEYEVIKKHPANAYKKLENIFEISPLSRNAILYHHENIDGSGYYNLPKEKQTIYTKILHIVDIYDSLTSIRKHRGAYSHAEAIEYIMGNTNKLFDEEVVKVFINKFPLYPIGITVHLSNGQKAVVYSNKKSKIRPTIKTFDGDFIDLSESIQYRSVTILGIE